MGCNPQISYIRHVCECRFSNNKISIHCAQEYSCSAHQFHSAILSMLLAIKKVKKCSHGRRVIYILRKYYTKKKLPFCTDLSSRHATRRVAPVSLRSRKFRRPPRCNYRLHGEEKNACGWDVPQWWNVHMKVREYRLTCSSTEMDGEV